MLDKKSFVILLVIFIIAFLIRLVPISQSSNVLKCDQSFFHGEAIEILEGRGFGSDGVPLSFRPPGYSFFLAVIYFLLGRNLLVAKIVQALMGSSLCVLVYFLGKKLFSETIGLISALILTFNLSFVYMPTNILSENLSIIIFLVSMLYLVRIWNSPSFKDEAILGFTLGLAALVRAEIQLLPFFIFFAMIIKARYERQRVIGLLKNFTVIILFFLLPIIPWAIRNYRIHHAFVPIATEGGITFYISNAISEINEFGSGINDEVTKKAETMTGVKSSHYYYKETIKHIKKNLTKIPKLIFYKILSFWSPFDWELAYGKVVYNPIFVFSLPFFILGIFFLQKRLIESLPLYTPILYYFLLALVFQGSARFRAQVEPCIIVIAAGGMWHFIKKFSNKFIPYLTILTLLITNFIIYLYTDPLKAGLKNILQQIGLW